MKKVINKINKLLFFALLLTLTITFFTRNNYRSVNEIVPEVLKEPVQKELRDKKVIKFTKDDYQYELTPQYTYEINGLIVHKMDYRWFSIYKRDSVFPMDLCLIWGDNVASKVYQNKDLKFSQDFRFCLYHWFGKVNFNQDQVTNNHLVIDDINIEKKLKQLSTGDQIKVRGILVNIKATNLGEPGKYDPEKFAWTTSTDRSDTGGGACETIYVKDVEILKKANPISYYLYQASLYGLGILIIINILIFFVTTTIKFKK